MAYKPHIDGLRAFAVILVVLFHARVPYFEGGFIGVDVFFVISGFLITSIIESEMSAGSFSVISFYERRARRILPALFTVVLASLVAGAMTLPPHDLKSLSLSALAATIFGSNFFFWLQPRGYFADVHWNMPLLHTWSLAVEEQFYLFFPVILLAVRRYSRLSISTLIGSLLCVSLGLAIWGAHAKPSATFYLLPTRMWELMTGALLAVQLPKMKAVSATLPANALSLAGASLILLPLTTYNSATIFPGANALAPCIGAAALILCGFNSKPLVVRVLASKVAVFIGLISYPLYLWHWPILTFVYRFQYGTLDAWSAASSLAVAFGLAWLTWRFIEQPVRNYPVLRARWRTLPAAAAAGIVLSLASIPGWITNGLVVRIPASLQEAAVLNERAQSDWDYPCDTFKRKVTAESPIDLCKIGIGNKDTILFWGDSHVEQTFSEVKRLADRTGQSLPRDIIFATSGGCLPILGLEHDAAGYHCDEFTTAAFARALQSDVKRVVMSGFWAEFFPGLDNAPHNVYVRIVNGSEVAFRSEEDVLSFLSATLMAEVQALKGAGKEVVLVMPYPNFPYPIPEYIWRRVLYGVPPETLLTREGYLAGKARIREVIAQVAGKTGSEIADPAALLCESECLYHEEMVSLYKDSHHLARKGIERIRPMLLQLIGVSPALVLAQRP